MKYRVFDGKKMHYSDDFDETFVMQMSGILGRFNGKTYDTDRESIVMQYTGLKDKNGKEIYEGDIVDFESSVEKGFHIKGTVTFENGIFVVKEPGFEYHRDELPDSLYDWIDNNDVEVIGNIHQNPELL